MKTFILLTVSILTFIIRAEATCMPFTICSKARDSIKLDFDRDSSLRQQVGTDDLTWIVQPPNPFNSILLVFMDFKPTSQVKVMMLKRDGGFALNDYVGGSGVQNFDILRDDVVQIIILAKNDLTTSFKLNYFSDCAMLSGQDISFPPTSPSASQSPLSAMTSYTKNRRTASSTSDSQTKCWLLNITVTPQELMKRIYVIVRDARLADNYKLQLWDVGRTETIAEIDGEREYETYAFDTLMSRTIMIDMVCKHDYDCVNEPSQLNYFKLATYVMNENDINCIELQRQCSMLIDEMIPRELCNMGCASFNKMLETEYEIEERETAPVFRSDEVFRSQESRLTAQIRRRKGNCPLDPRFCNCPRSTDLRRFCLIKGKCYQHGSCTWACIFMKMTTCLRIRFLAIVKLL